MTTDTTVVVPVFRMLLLTATLLAAGCGNLQAPPPPSVARAPEGSAASPAPPVAAAAAATPAPAPPASPAPPAPAPAPPPPVLPYDQAVLAAATALLNNAKLPPDGSPPQPKYTIVIDPLIDGMTGAQSIA